MPKKENILVNEMRVKIEISKFYQQFLAILCICVQYFNVNT